MGNWHDFAAALPDVELLVTGCAIFAAAYLGQVKTILELWQQARDYPLPAELFEDVWSRNAIERFVQELASFDIKVLQLERIFSPAQETICHWTR